MAAHQGPHAQEGGQTSHDAQARVVLQGAEHEGRGIGLLAKLQAYRLQDQGLDTVDANLEQGLPADAREYSAAGQILADLGMGSLDILTNNPEKIDALTGYGPEVAGRSRIEIVPTHDNIEYLRTKRDRMGHDLPGVAEWLAAHPGYEH